MARSAGARLVATRLANAFGQAGRAQNTRDRYFADPVAFARECIAWGHGEALAPYQEEILRHLVSDFRVVSRGPRGYGKSAGFSILILWFAVTRELARIPWKIVTTAGAWFQLETYLWPEVHLWAKRIRWDVLGIEPWRDDRELLKIGVQLRFGSAVAANPKVSAKIEGGHAEQFLYVFDEAKLIPSTTWDSAEGSASSTTGRRELRWLAQSSGGDADGRFWELSAGKIAGWWPRHVTKDEAIAAGRMSRSWAERMAELWGEDSAPYQNHVLGNFASTGGTNTVIRLSDVERAFERWREWKAKGSPWAGPLVLGVDVGSGNLNRDPAAIASRRGDVVEDVEIFRFSEKHPEMQLAGIVSGMLERGGVANVDGIGQGSGVVSRLLELGREVSSFVAGGRSDATDSSGSYGFQDLRSEIWWRCREDLALPDATLCLPDDPILLGELVAPRWEVRSGTKIKIESKDEIAGRLRKLESRKELNEGGSTNRADAVLMTRVGWVPSLPETTSNGGGYRRERIFSSGGRVFRR